MYHAVFFNLNNTCILFIFMLLCLSWYTVCYSRWRKKLLFIHFYIATFFPHSEFNMVLSLFHTNLCLYKTFFPPFLLRKSLFIFSSYLFIIIWYYYNYVICYNIKIIWCSPLLKENLKLKICTRSLVNFSALKFYVKEKCKICVIFGPGLLNMYSDCLYFSH